MRIFSVNLKHGLCFENMLLICTSEYCKKYLSLLICSYQYTFMRVRVYPSLKKFHLKVSLLHRSFSQLKFLEMIAHYLSRAVQCKC